MTYVIQALVGIAVALLTMIVTPSLQHYFWRRQRHAERQLAVIEEVNRLAAEVQYLLQVRQEHFSEREDIRARVERLSLAMGTIPATVGALFSFSGAEAYEQLNQVLGLALRVREGMSLDQRRQLGLALGVTHQHAQRVLYGEMGIPVRSLGQRMREQIWQPLRALVRDPLQRTWRDYCWSTLQHWGSQAWTRMCQSCASVKFRVIAQPGSKREPRGESAFWIA